MSAPKPANHVYVHAPFCSRRCVYCDFAVEVSSKPNGQAWFDAIINELRLLRDQGVVVSEVPRTLYVGGGTPSLMPPELFGALGLHFGQPGGGAGEAEWTAEANPESFTQVVADSWARAGVNRVSLGVQTFSPEALRWMGRLHTPEDATDAVARARSAGIHNVSVDLIFGLPDDVTRSWSEDLQRALELEVPHVSLYGLTVERGTPLDRMISEERTGKPREGRYRDEFLAARDAMTEAGYVHYEVSNFALPGSESRHNQAYWNDAQYLGLGNGAHSYYGGRRWWNHRSWPRYLEDV
ncbi:MAG: radical SAM family heme chaperone HemW, partial [Longimicrobiales bacterium]